MITDLLSTQISLKDIVIALAFAVVAERIGRIYPWVIGKLIDQIATKSDELRRRRIAQIETKLRFLRQIAENESFRDEYMLISDLRLMQSAFFSIIFMIMAACLVIVHAQDVLETLLFHISELTGRALQIDDPRTLSHTIPDVYRWWIARIAGVTALIFAGANAARFGLELAARFGLELSRRRDLVFKEIAITDLVRRLEKIENKVKR